ncbi:MAG: hypothetical protein GYB67_09090 [Chloroflexi bacterium]|nr:hypothetical protein [Chloroflexota bacterium]
MATNTPSSAIQSITDTATPMMQIDNFELIDVPLGEREPQAGQNLQITAFNFQRTGHAIDRITVEIRNLTEATQSGRAWYLLSPPGAGDPWSQAVYISPEQPVEALPAGETAVIIFDSPTLPLAGDYNLSAWAHQIDASSGESNHADGVIYPTSLFIGPPLFLEIDYVDLIPTDEGEQIVYVTFTIRNNTVDVLDIAYSYSISQPDDTTPWVTGAFTLPFQEMRLEPGAQRTLTLRNVIALPAGEFIVNGWLHQFVGDQLEFQSSFEFPQSIQIATAQDA